MSTEIISRPRKVEAFLTTEQIHVQSTASLSPLWRLNDPLCARFLNIGKNPTHFAAVRAFFPFIRDVSVFQIPRELEYIPALANAAFHSGFHFGTKLPNVAGDILDENGVEHSEALRRVRVLKSYLKGRPTSSGNLYSVFQQIAENQWKATPAAELVNLVATTTFNAFKTGLAAATSANVDPLSLDDFASSIRVPLDGTALPIVWRSIIASPADLYGRPVEDWLRHPLLRVAEVNYPETPIQRAVILDFLERRLTEFGAVSEKRCPIRTVDWVAAALDYGERLKRDEPWRVADIVGELSADELESTAKLIRSVIATSGPEPRALTQAILKWYREQHRSSFIIGYGRRLERVIHCSDFAIWIPWAGLDGRAI